eukprot:TRINITY_DN0_c2559_g1_i1.p1 TRINITY_DN0_c2559_g1~~TRINITY_DN0_c2559_g1_i1.p1  ORF type:complete len:156 (+),score=46.80 TRINITY_DN0_c2559_g1_i1:41-508(+)
MGWEEEVPPKPTREQELQFINDLEKEWLAQPNYKWYMNESLRSKKLDYSTRNNQLTKEWAFHFCVGAALTGLLVLPLGRFFYRWGSGVPTYFRPKMYYAAEMTNYNQYRNVKASSYQVPLWLGLSTAYAYWFTDFSRVDDEYLENLQPHVMFKQQ